MKEPWTSHPEAVLSYFPNLLEIPLMAVGKGDMGSLASNNFSGLCVSVFVCLTPQVSFWVVREILTAQTLKIRAEILSHFVKIAKVSRFFFLPLSSPFFLCPKNVFPQ